MLAWPSPPLTDLSKFYRALFAWSCSVSLRHGNYGQTSRSPCESPTYFHPMDFLNALRKILGKNDSRSMPALVTCRRGCRPVDQITLVLLDIVLLNPSGRLYCRHGQETSPY